MAFKLAEAYVQLSSRGMGTVRRALGGIKSGLMTLLNPAALVGTAMAAIGIGGGIGIGAMISLAAKAEQTAVSFEVLLGSAEKAKEMVKEIDEFAARTPFEQGELAGVTKQLLAFGVAQKDVIPTLSTLGDIAALSGSKINELASIYGKAKGTGVVMTEILDQFLERGIPLGRELAEVMGVTEKEIRKLAPTGKITFEILETALKNLTGEGGQFFDGMSKLSKTTAGLWSTFTGNLKKSLGLLGDALIETFDINSLLRGMSTWVQAFGEKIKELQPVIEFLADGFTLIKEIVSASVGLTTFWGRALLKIGDSFGGFLGNWVIRLEYLIELAKDFNYWVWNWGASRPPDVDKTAKETAADTAKAAKEAGEKAVTKAADTATKTKPGSFKITSLAGLADQMQSEAGKRLAERNADANIRTAVAVEQMAAERKTAPKKTLGLDDMLAPGVPALNLEPIPAFQ